MKFNRTYQVVVDGTVFLSSADNAAVTFTVENNLGGGVSFADIEIFNLSESTNQQLKQHKKIELHAGYDGDMGCIFRGYIVNVLSTYDDGLNKPTLLSCRSWSSAQSNIKINKAFGKGTPTIDVVRHVAEAFDLPVTINGSLTTQYARGYTVVGAPVNLSREHDLSWYVDASGVVISIGGELRKSSVEYNKDNLLMGRTEITEIGCNVAVKLDYKLLPNMRATITPASYKINFEGVRLRPILIKEGDYRVLSVIHEGTYNHGDDAWRSTAECVRL
jgi:hypothetical protein